MTTPYSTVAQAQAAAAAAVERLADAEAEFDAALDRGAWMTELRVLDARVVRARRDHDHARQAVDRLRAATTKRQPEDRDHRLDD